MKVEFIVNSTSRKSHRLVSDIKSITGDIDVTVSLTQHAGHAWELAQTSKADVVVSCGGDGTNNEVVNGLMEHEAYERPGFSFLSIGSGNDFARSMPPRGLSELVHALKTNQSSLIDVLCVESNNHSRYALNMITAGLGALVAQSVNQNKLPIPPFVSYYAATAYWLLKFRAVEVEVLGKAPRLMSSFILAFGNGKFAGSGLGLTPQSSLDGPIGFTNIGAVSVIDFIRYLGPLKKGQKINDSRIHYENVDSLSFRPTRQSISIETDGEFFGQIQTKQEVRISKEDAALRLF